MERIVIDGFESLTKQQMFDMAVQHIGTTRKPSLSEDNTCVYGGSGCNAAPFLTATGRVIGDMEYPGYGWVTLVDDNQVPDHNSAFIQRLQIAHDKAAAKSIEGVDFMSAYVMYMKDVALSENLYTDKLNALNVSPNLN